VAAGVLRCDPKRWFDFLKMGHIGVPGKQFPRDFRQTRAAGSINNTFLRFCQTQELLGAKGGLWGAIKG
jgi:hypothetical protein